MFRLLWLRNIAKCAIQVIVVGQYLIIKCDVQIEKVSMFK